MPTIIDELVTTVSLDPRGYKKGADDTIELQKGLRDSIKRTSGEVETYTKRSSEFFTGLRREATGFLLTIAGATGFADWTKNIIAGDAATGRLATNLGIATERVTAWQLAIKSVGGTAGEADAALQSMSQGRANLLLTGRSGMDDNALRYFGVDLRNNDPQAALMQIAKASHGMNRQVYQNLIGRLGLSPNVGNFLASPDAAKTLRDMEKLGGVTQRDAEEAEKFQRTLTELEARLNSGMRPAVTGMLTQLDDFETKTHGVTDTVNLLAKAIGSVALVITSAGASMAAFFRLASDKAFFDNIKAGNWRGASDEAHKFLDPVGRWLNDNVYHPLGLSGAPTGPTPDMPGAPGLNRGGALSAGDGSGSDADIAARIFHNESSGDPHARNPHRGSTAGGLGQFTDKTWLRMYKQRFGSRGMSDSQILAQKMDGATNKDMTLYALAGYRKVLNAHGMPVTAANMYLMHFLGPEGAVAFLKANPGASAASVLAGVYSPKMLRSALAQNGDILRGDVAHALAWVANGVGPDHPAHAALHAARPRRITGMNAQQRLAMANGPGNGGGSNTHIDLITIDARGKDGAAIGRDLQAQLQRRSISTQANSGMRP